jgi:hypothetical protein
LDACYARIDAVLETLQDMTFQLEVDRTGIKERYDSAQIEELFSASYTTQAERDVLRAALYGTEMAATPQYSIGNEVELF